MKISTGKTILKLQLGTMAVLAQSFNPETDGLFAGNTDHLPIAYSVPDSIREFVASGNFPADSIWSSSYVRGSDDHDYLVVSHAMYGTPVANCIYRASIFDITDPTVYKQFQIHSNDTLSFTSNNLWNTTNDGYTFVGLPSNSDPKFRVSSSRSEFQFDLTYSLDSPIILAGGLGNLNASGSLFNQWSSPAGSTAGWLSINEKNVTVVPEESITWFDRQWNGAPPNWQWFALHVKAGNSNEYTPMSIWTWHDADNDTDIYILASIREDSGNTKVVAGKSLVNGDRKWTSEASGKTYTLDWDLELQDGTSFQIKSTRDDQELSNNGVFPTYTGYLNVTGIYDGEEVNGYGLVEILPGLDFL